MSVLPFSYSGQEVRVIQVGGEPWFVLADVARILDLGNPSMVARRLDGDALSTAEVTDSLGRHQTATTASEAGLYEVIFMSRKPEAKQFRRWVTHEVIPSIRKRGGYLTPEAIEKTLTDPDFIIRLATELKAERAKVAELKPKADYVDIYVADEDLRLLRNVAKSISVPEGVLRDALVAHGWIYVEESSRWSNSQGCKVIEHRYSPMSDKARYFRPVPNHLAPRFKGEVMHTLKVTPAGAEAISKMAKRWGLVVQEVAA